MATETVETAIYRLQVEGEEQIKRATVELEGMSVATEDLTKSNRRLTQQIESGLAKYDPLIRAQQRYNEELEINKRAIEAGAASAQQLAAYQELTRANYEKQVKAINDAAVATENLRRQQASLTALPGGVAAAAGGRDAYAAQFEAAAKAQDEQVASLNRLRAAMNPLEEVQGRVAKQMVLYRQYVKEGSMSQQEFAVASKQAAEQLQAAGGLPTAVNHMNQLGNSTKAARYEMINLGRQAQDVVVSLGSGQNLLMVGLQQGSQILDVFLSSERSAAEIFKGFAGTIGSFLINPITIAVGAVAALTTAVLSLANAWDKAQVSTQRALSGAGRMSGTTVADINAFVERSSGTSGTRLSGAEARELANAFTATGKIVVSQLDDMSDAVVGFANKTGKTTKEVRDLMVQFATDPVKGLEEMEKVWGAVDVKTRETVKSLSDADDKTGAFKLSIQAFSDESAKAAKNMSALDQAVRLLFSTREFVTPTGLENQVDVARQRVEALINQPRQQTEAGQAQAAEAMKRLNGEYERLFAAQQKLIDQQMQLKFNEIAKAAEIVSAAILPQINQIKNLTTEIEALERAKQKGALNAQGEGALTVGKGMKEDLEQSLATTVRITEETNRIAAAHQGVSREVAKQLADLDLQLELTRAVGAAEKQAAQFAIDRAAAKRQGATDAEAELIATKKQLATQEQLNAASKERVWQLQNSMAVANAVGGAAKIEAQYLETINRLRHEGLSLEQATTEAMQQRAKTEADLLAKSKERIWQIDNELKAIKGQNDALQQRMQRQGTSAVQGAGDTGGGGGGVKLTEDFQVTRARWRELAQATKDAESGSAGVAENNEKIKLTQEEINGYLAKARVDNEAIGQIVITTGDETEKQAQDDQQLVQSTEQRAKATEGISLQQKRINELTHEGLSEDQARTQQAKELSLEIAQRLLKAGQEIEMLRARTHLQEMQIQYQRTYDELISKGASSEKAKAVAEAEFQVEVEKANAEIRKQIDALDHSNKQILASIDGIDASVLATEAYNKALDSGADITHAIAIYWATIKNEIIKAEAEIDKVNIAAQKAKTAEDAARKARSLFEPVTMPTGKHEFVGGAQVSYPGGATGKILSLSSQPFTMPSTDPEKIASAALVAGGLGAALTAVQRLGEAGESQVQAIYDLMNKTADKTTQAANIQQEIAYERSLPATIAREQKILDLQQSIEQLTQSTDDLNATNQELLSPFYTQDPRTSHIGFRSQGMAGGGYVDVPGLPSANDNMIASVPVASGERIYVDPMTVKRGNAGTTTINITAPMTFSGPVNRDEVGRTVYQTMQMTSRSIAAAQR